MAATPLSTHYVCHAGADLGFIKGGGGGGLTQGINLLGRDVQSMLELGGSGGMPPPPQEIFEK